MSRIIPAVIFFVSFVIVLMIISAGTSQVRSAELLCYPGLECSSASVGAVPEASLVSPPVPGFRFGQNFVRDEVQNLLWSRELYAIGDTTKGFKEAFDGNESIGTAYASARKRAASAIIGGVGGWRLATQKDLNSLLDRLAPTTIYAYFRARTVQLPTRSVLGVIDEGTDNPTRVHIDGTMYANSSLGRARGHLGTPQLNPYGFWLVRGITPDIEKDQASVAEPLRQYFEPIEEQRIKPASVFQIVRRQQDSFEAIASPSAFAIVSTTAALNSRFFARYNMKPLPRGALVSAEVHLRGLSADGLPIPTVSIQINPGSSQTSTSPKDLWQFAGGTPVGVWQMPESARLELPEHVVRNVFNVGDNFYLAFAANFNKCEFEIPEVIIRFVRESHLLTRRNLP